MFRRRPVCDHARQPRPLPLSPAESHPLSFPPQLSASGQSRAGRRLPGRLWDGLDPLTRMALEREGCGVDEDPASGTALHVLTWQSARASLLQTASGAARRPLVTVSSRSSASGPDSPADTALSLHVHAGGDWRLALLDLSPAGGCSHVELLAFLKRARDDMRAAWLSESRTCALKLVIQCCKLLESVPVPLLYPAMFCHVVDMLDTFGTLVYERLVTWDGGPVGSQGRGRCTGLSDAASEMALNWFYKVATIKELVPRLYVEAALLRCFELLWPDGFDASVRRLSLAANGVFQPLVAAYLRCYICRVSGPSRLVLDHFLARLPAEVVAPGGAPASCVTLSAVVDGELRLLLLQPLLWCVQNALAASGDASRLTVERQLMEPGSCSASCSLLLLSCLLHALKGRQVASWTELARVCVEAVSRYQQEQPESSADPVGAQLAEQVLVKLGELVEAVCSLRHALSNEQARALLSCAWTGMQALPPASYVRCAAAWLYLVTAHMKPRQLGLVLTDVAERVARIPPLQRSDALLERIVGRVLPRADEGNVSADVLLLPALATLLDCLQEVRVRLRVHVRAIETVCRCLQGGCDHPGADLLADTGLAWCWAVSECCTQAALVSGERPGESVDRAVCDLVRAVFRQQLVTDPSRVLDLLADVRSQLFTMQPVVEHLVLLACSLLVDQTVVTGSGGESESAASVLAFCHVTIVRMDCAVSRLRLLSLLTRLALSGRGRAPLKAQALACAEAAVSALSELPSARPSLAVSLAATLMIPALGRQRAAVLRRFLEAVLTSAALPQSASAECILVLTQLLRLLSAAAEKTPPGDWADKLGAEVLTATLKLLATAYSSAADQHLTGADARAASHLMLQLTSVCDRRWPDLVQVIRRLYVMCSPCVEVKPHLLNSVREWLQSDAGVELSV